MNRQRADVLGSYILPGRVFDPLDGPRQAVAAETLGLGSVWLGERWDLKEAGAMLGAVAQATAKIRFGTAVTHPHTRHPLALAGMATTLQALSGGRFTLGIGRSGGGVWSGRGLPAPTTAMLRDVATILRQVWAGETVSYDGPLGRFPELRAVTTSDAPPPALALAAIGPRTLALAGELYDVVILHPLLTTEAIARSCEVVRANALRAGRAPEEVRIVATVVAALDLGAEEVAAVVGGRAITYLQTPGFGELLVEANHWDPAVLDLVRNHPMLSALRGGLADWTFTLPELAKVAQVLPPAWLTEAAAIGDAASGATRVRAYLEAGADEVILHGNSPVAFGPLVEMFARSEREH